MLYHRSGSGVPVVLTGVGVLENLAGLLDRSVAPGTLLLGRRFFGSSSGAIGVGHIRCLPVTASIAHDQRLRGAKRDVSRCGRPTTATGAARPGPGPGPGTIPRVLWAELPLVAIRVLRRRVPIPAMLAKDRSGLWAGSPWRCVL